MNDKFGELTARLPSLAMVFCLTSLGSLPKSAGPGWELSFDGTGGYVSIATTGSLTGAFTVDHFACVVTPTAYSIYAGGSLVGMGAVADSGAILYDPSAPWE